MKLTILNVIQHRQTVRRLILARQNVKQYTQRSVEHSLLSCRHEKLKLFSPLIHSITNHLSKHT